MKTGDLSPMFLLIKPSATNGSKMAQAFVVAVTTEIQVMGERARAL